MHIRHMIIGLAALLAPAQIAAHDAASPQIDANAKSEVVQELAVKLREAYVFPEIAQTAASELLRRVESGAYSEALTAPDFAETLRSDLREVGNDRHFQVRFDPSFVEPPAQEDHELPSAEEMATVKRQLARQNYGIFRTAKLPGNVGYMDVRFFGPTEFVAPAYESAMHLLGGSNAIIVDLRSNGGGDPESVVQLVSHFFGHGDERLINSIYDRTQDNTREFYLVRSAQTRFTGPIYVLTSDYTFSGGEEFAYDMQTQQRATLIGETTGGGANPGRPFSLGHGFYAFIPTGRAINPVTGTNWEHVGVKPDHAVPAEDAMAVAYRMAMEGIAAAEPDPPTRAEYEALAQGDPAAIADMPDWKHPRK